MTKKCVNLQELCGVLGLNVDDIGEVISNSKISYGNNEDTLVWIGDFIDLCNEYEPYQLRQDESREQYNLIDEDSVEILEYMKSAGILLSLGC
jgi:hypothetical protein